MPSAPLPPITNHQSPISGATLVTGVTGFAGSWLVEALLERGETVVGLSRQAVWPAEAQHLAGRVELHACDITDGDRLEALLRMVRPARIYHLAGYAATGRSFREPDAAWEGNLTGTRRLYDAVHRWGGRPRILYVGSGLIYGDTPNPPTEETAPRPSSPYAASKAAADLASFQYTCNPGLDIVRARPFNHIGPRQSPQFAVASFARQIALAERGEGPAVLETGNLRPERDLTDVRDVVSAYLLLMERGRTGEAYNIGSGQSQSMRTVLDRLLALTGQPFEVRAREDLSRPTDVHRVQVEASKLRRETGWAPHYPLQQTLADILDYWRENSRRESGR
jgi:GDP-4-dehydro-6-deoxy-D-mannose reductase